MLPEQAVAISTILLMAFAGLGAIDAFYIHLYRLRLHERAESWSEHAWHTGRSLLFAPILLTIFLAPTGGVVLWIGVALLAIDQLAEMLDADSERTSRRSFGGVARGELMLHVVLLIVRAAAIALALVSRPQSAWSLDAPWVAGTYAPWVRDLVFNLVPGAALGAIAHLWLAWKYRPASCCSRGTALA